MRLLRIIHSMDPAGGGPAAGIREITPCLSELGVTTYVLTLDSSEADWVTGEPFSLHAIGPIRGSYGYTRKLNSWLRLNLKEFSAVIIHGIWQYSSFGSWRELSRMRKPYFVYPHGMLDPWFRKNYSLKHLKKMLYWPWAEYRVLRDAEAVLFTSEEERLRAGSSFRPYRCREQVVRYGVARPAGESEKQKDLFYRTFPETQDKRILLYLGRIHEKKGIDLLLKAFGRVNERMRESAHAEKRRSDDARGPHLVIAGPCKDAAYMTRLRRLASDLCPPSSVLWTGMLEGDVKWGAFYACDAFILPSHQENFGIAVAEALACEKSVLISNKVNIWREIKADRAGIVDDDTLKGTERLIEKWIAMGEGEKASMGKCAGECFKNHFHIEKAAESLIQVIEGSIGNAEMG